MPIRTLSEGFVSENSKIRNKFIRESEIFDLVSQIKGFYLKKIEDYFPFNFK